MASAVLTPGRVVIVLVIPPVVAVAVCTVWAVDSAAYAYRLWRTARDVTRSATRPLPSPGG